MGRVDPAAARLIGQRLMVGFDGTAWNDDIAFCIGQLRVGGLILFGCVFAINSAVRLATRASK